ncbi:MAG: hypothetical protein AB1705_08785 [Verrucomicrobiota bacterium]
MSAPTGYSIASYVSSIDDSVQPFALWVPRTYHARKAYPLLVTLHGSDADHRMIPEQCWRIQERGFREDIILLSPFGRGEVGYRWMGEADIWDAMNEVKLRYRIDARRQYLTGLSMGGYAAWRLACEYPEQWAAIAPVCGGGDVAALKALKSVPVWCVHGENDDIVPVNRSRELIAELKRLKYRHRYDELKHTGHHSWEWLYNPNRRDDTLVDWLLKFRKGSAPAPVVQPRRQGVLKDLFLERVIISYPADTPVPREVELLRAEAERIAQFHFGDCEMRSGRLLVKTDRELTPADLRSANHLMLGRSDNHAILKQAERRLLARHARGQLRVDGEAYLGKTLVAATVQRSPWNAARLLGIITYQQFRQMRGIAQVLFDYASEPFAVNVYDALQKRFIRQAVVRV